MCSPCACGQSRASASGALSTCSRRRRRRRSEQDLVVPEIAGRARAVIKTRISAPTAYVTLQAGQHQAQPSYVSARHRHLACLGASCRQIVAPPPARQRAGGGGARKSLFGGHATTDSSGSCRGETCQLVMSCRRRRRRRCYGGNLWRGGKSTRRWQGARKVYALATPEAAEGGLAQSGASCGGSRRQSASACNAALAFAASKKSIHIWTCEKRRGTCRPCFLVNSFRGAAGATSSLAGRSECSSLDLR